MNKVTTNIWQFLIITSFVIFLIYLSSQVELPSNLMAVYKVNFNNNDVTSTNKYLQTSNVIEINNITKQNEYKTNLINLLPKWDFTTLINFEPFRFEKFNNVCDGPLSFLILIHSSPNNIDRREAIRATWGRPTENVKILFLFGAVKDEETEKILEKEDTKFKDIIQGNFIDAYRNMTYKHVMAFKYAIYYCPQVQYILKVDDDIFINIPVAKRFLENKYNECGTEDLIQCKIITDRPVARDGKWGLSFEEYPTKIMPNFCMGAAIIYSWDMAYKLYSEAQKGEYIWIDDLHITGTLAKRFNIVHKNLGSYVIEESDLIQIMNSNGKKGKKNFVFGIYDIAPEIIKKVGQALKDNFDVKNITLFPENCQ